MGMSEAGVIGGIFMLCCTPNRQNCSQSEQAEKFTANPGITRCLLQKKKIKKKLSLPCSLTADSVARSRQFHTPRIQTNTSAAHECLAPSGRRATRDLLHFSAFETGFSLVASVCLTFKDARSGGIWARHIPGFFFPRDGRRKKTNKKSKEMVSNAEDQGQSDNTVTEQSGEDTGYITLNITSNLEKKLHHD